MMVIETAEYGDLWRLVGDDESEAKFLNLIRRNGV